MALLQLKGISKSYGQAKILDDIDLTVEKGEIMALIGPTGSGKDHLASIDRPPGPAHQRKHSFR